MTKRFLIRDEWDGVWAEADTLEEAEPVLDSLNATENAEGRYQLRIDDMED